VDADADAAADVVHRLRVLLRSRAALSTHALSRAGDQQDGLGCRGRG
jgi:hypothetical protein